LSRRALVLLALLLPLARAEAQELEARTYANAPRGVNFAALAYSYSRGNVLLDPALPIEDARAEVHSAVLRYVRTLGLFGKAAKLKLALPVSDGAWNGLVDGVERERTTSGLGDTRIALEVNFSGAPALDPREFAGYRQKTIVGASLGVVAPTGGYDDTRLINLGSNRWALRGEIGASRALGHLIVEAAGEVWHFTDNDDFLGQTLSQEPFYALKADAIWSFRPGFWVGALVGRGQGAQSSVEGVPRDNEQRNWRFGLAASYPIDRRQGLSVAVQTANAEGAGSEFDQAILAYQYAWGF
jgi:hypothetical protein